MYELINHQLRVQVLDPRTDLQYLGSRYCVGGYVWQIIDQQLGPLLAGPQYPSAQPDTYHGQGAPDMFLKTLDGETAAVGDHVGVIGVGNVLRTTREPFHVSSNRQIILPIAWQVSQTPSLISMSGTHRHRDWAYALVRDVSLDERTLRVATTVTNQGTIILPVCAFAHPFFPPVQSGILCRLSVPVAMSENPGFYQDVDGWIRSRPGHEWEHGAYQVLSYDAVGDGMTITQRHNLLAQVVTRLDFMPSRIAIWGNDRTFSFEPFIERDLAPNTTVRWSVEYRF